MFLDRELVLKIRFTKDDVVSAQRMRGLHSWGLKATVILGIIGTVGLAGEIIYLSMNYDSPDILLAWIILVVVVLIFIFVPAITYWLAPQVDFQLNPRSLFRRGPRLCHHSQTNL